MGGSNVNCGQYTQCVIWVLFLNSFLFFHPRLQKGPDKRQPSGNCMVVSLSDHDQAGTTNCPSVISRISLSPDTQRRHFLQWWWFFNSREERIYYVKWTCEIDENGAGEGTLHGMSFPDHLCISFTPARNLLIKSNFRSSLCEICHRNHQISHIMTRP